MAIDSAGAGFGKFWVRSDFSVSEYEGQPLTPDMVSAVELELGYKLPSSYITLLKTQNGGVPNLTTYKISRLESPAPCIVKLSGIYGLDRQKPRSLCGSFGSRFWIDEWGYPPIGVYFGNSESAGHSQFCLDYRDCGPMGEPKVVYVDQESDYAITFVCEDFKQLIQGLEVCDPRLNEIPSPRVLSVKISPDFKKKFKKYTK